MFRKVSDAPIQPTRTEVTAPKTRVADGPGLGSIQAQVPASGAKPPPGIGSQAAPGGVVQLQQITGTPNLGKITDKSDAIAQRLGPDLTAKLEARLASATRSERKDMEKLLHFSYNKLGNTDATTRQEIRSGIAAFLAEGGGIAEGRAFRERLLEVPVNDCKAMVNRLKQQNEHPAKTITENVLKVKNTTPEQFARVLPALLSFPADPSEAGQTVVAAKGLTLARDENGKLEVRNLSLARTNIEVPASNKNLDAAKLQQIRAVFDKVAGASYSTQGAVLDFMRFFRESTEFRELRGMPTLSMAEALERYHPDGTAITDRYNGRGNCMGHADKIASELQKLGIEAKVVGHYTLDLIRMQDPRSTVPDTSMDIPGEVMHTGQVTHLDVIVPYTDSTGAERALVISPGIGTTDRDAYNDYAITELKKGTTGQLKFVDPTTGRIDSSEAQKNTLSYRDKIQLTNTSPNGPKDQNKLFGIDLIGGKLYLNRAASNEYRANHGAMAPGQQAGAISFDFKDAMANPRAPTTIKLWNEDTGAYEDTNVNKLTAMLVFMHAVKEQFGQPDGFVDDVMTLAANYDDYKTSVMNPVLAAQADTKAERAAALAAKPTDTGPVEIAWQSHLTAAGEAILSGDAATAAAEYRAAALIGRPGG